VSLALSSPAGRPSPPAAADLRTAQRQRRDRIVAAAVAMMADTEYERIQVKDVAESAEVALGTLYRYFVSKDHLFAEALVAWADGFGGDLAGPSDGPTVDKVKALYRRAVRAFERRPNVYGVLLALQGVSEPHASLAFKEFGERQRAAFDSVLSRVPEARRRTIVAVMGAVLDTNLRNWRLGHQTIADCYAAMDDAADLIFRR
jgi:AcrR family transcriptional regulator